MAGSSSHPKAPATKKPTTNVRSKLTSPQSQKSTVPVTGSKKRKLVDSTQDGDEVLALALKKSKNQHEEKRLKQFRKHAPQSFLLKLERSTSQRMVVICRTRSGSDEDLHEDIDIVGTTGNIYTVTIGRLPTCTCPDSQKGNECKHKVYALATVLRASYEYQYQRALLSSEVQEILANAPQIPENSAEGEDNDGKRKPIEGECPICYMDFDPDNNEIVWCKAGCGNNMHKDCFKAWQAAQRGQEVRCVYCRTPWQMDHGDIDTIRKGGVDSGEGYVNVAEQFGLSRARDYSTYHQPWVRRQFGYGM